MRLVTYSSRSETRIGALISRGAQNYILGLNRAVPSRPTDMIEFLEAGAAAMAAAKSQNASGKALRAKKYICGSEMSPL